MRGFVIGKQPRKVGFIGLGSMGMPMAINITICTAYIIDETPTGRIDELGFSFFFQDGPKHDPSS